MIALHRLECRREEENLLTVDFSCDVVKTRKEENFHL